jgi:mono/diheme cytochrome c family protein
MNVRKSGTVADRKTSSNKAATVAALLLLAAVVACATGEIRSVRAAVASRTTMDGVYNDDQAARGKSVYAQSCSNCHMDDLSGGGQALPLAGEAFMSIWENQSLGDMFDLVHRTMPQDKPGSLTPEATVDVMAYILQYNQFPSGKDELKTDPELLKAIVIARKTPPKQ